MSPDSSEFQRVQVDPVSENHRTLGGRQPLPRQHLSSPLVDPNPPQKVPPLTQTQTPQF